VVFHAKTANAKYDILIKATIKIMDIPLKHDFNHNFTK